MRRLFFIALIPLLLFACESNNDNPSGPAGRPLLQIFLTDQPVQLKEVWVTIEEIEVHRAGQGWLTIDSDSQELDLMTLREREELLVVTELDEGVYTGIRLQVSEGHIVDNEEDRCDLKIPSEKIQIPVSFELQGGEITRVLLDFDAHQSVHVVNAGKSGQCILRPVIKPVNVRTE